MLSFTAASRHAARLLWGLSLCAGAVLFRAAAHRDWPVPDLQAIEAEPRQAIEAEPRDHALIRAQRVCVLNTLDSAGEIGETIAFRARRDGDRLSVSYFVHWSTERPWGDKSPLVSLAIDSVYSHFFFFLPGVRYFLHGPSDIEGATVVYRVEGERLTVLEGFADDEWHDPVHLTARELTDGEDGTVLMTAVWSHQLGARGAAQAAASPDTVGRRCYEGSELIPLTPQIAKRFWLGSSTEPRRARPAWR
jgi:hypothetical protein